MKSKQYVQISHALFETAKFKHSNIHKRHELLSNKVRRVSVFLQMVFFTLQIYTTIILGHVLSPAFISNSRFRNWTWFVLNWAPRKAVWQSEALCPHQWLLHLTEYFVRTARVAVQHHRPRGSDM